jgi:hypothetical protein
MFFTFSLPSASESHEEISISSISARNSMLHYLDVFETVKVSSRPLKRLSALGWDERRVSIISSFSISNCMSLSWKIRICYAAVS